MLVYLRIAGVLLVMALAQPAWAGVTSCPAGVEVSAATIKSVRDVIRIKARHPGKRVNFTGLDLLNADFSGHDLAGLCFTNSRLRNSNWSKATGPGIQFHKVDLSGSRWTRFKGDGVEFHYSMLNNADLAHAVLRRSIFDRTGMERIDASNADLTGGSLSGNALDSLKQAKFRFANMTGFRFECGIGQDDNCGQDSSEVSLVGANLTNATFHMASKTDWDLSGAILANTRLNLFQLSWIRASRIAGPVILDPATWTPARDAFVDKSRLPPRPALLTAADVRLVWQAMDKLKEPGFDCARARSAAERYICDRRFDDRMPGWHARGSYFAEADRELNQAYVLARKKDRSIVTMQRQWLRERDACMAVAEIWERDGCIREAYRNRSESLWRMAGRHADFAAGERRLYVDAQTAEFVSEIEDRRLRAKIAPLALWNSWQIVRIERDRVGRIFATGSGIGPNYHLGSLQSPPEGLAFDPVSGFYGARQPCMPGFGVCPIVRLQGRYLDVGPTGSRDKVTDEDYYNDYLTVGARAGFDRLVQVPLAGDEIARW